MRFLSLGGKSPSVDLATALLDGLAPDGGLYMPESLPRVPAEVFRSPPGMGEIGTALLRPFLEDVDASEAERRITDAFDFEIPLVAIEDGVYILELFHGPTLAFKDVAARFLARFLSWLSFEAGSDRDPERPLTVLVATSGDTGSAVAQAFYGVPATRVAVLFPRGKVSPLQEKQMATLGGNVEALSVAGTFDDCQRLVKEAFVDPELQERLFLTSANSINIGRLLPQMVYYVHGRAQLPQGAPPAVFAVPSGNFGNLTAGMLAHRLGMPAAFFVAATNVNDVVPAYLETGRYEPRPSRMTISNAMDVGDPSNFPRLEALYGGDPSALRRDLLGFRYDDESTRAAMREVYERTGYILDPHTAVGYLGLRDALAEKGGEYSGIVLSTAHPIKFREHVEPLLQTSIPVPERLAARLVRPSRALEIEPRLGELKEFLLAWN